METVALSEIGAGDVVESYDWNNRKSTFSEVVSVEHDGGKFSQLTASLKRVTLANGRAIKASQSHIILNAKGQYVAVGALKTGDEILLSSGQSSRVVKVSTTIHPDFVCKATIGFSIQHVSMFAYLHEGREKKCQRFG